MHSRKTAVSSGRLRKRRGGWNIIYIGNILKTEPSRSDEIWVICRSVGELRAMFNTHKNVLYIPELAPSEELFKYYRELVHWG